jgi:hypothetical protein
VQNVSTGSLELLAELQQLVVFVTIQQTKRCSLPEELKAQEGWIRTCSAWEAIAGCVRG